MLEKILTGELIFPNGEETINRASRNLRKKLRRIIDFLDLSSDDPQERIDSVLKLAKRQKAEFIEVIKSASISKKTRT